MELIIRMVNGVPYEQPIFIDNFVQAFPHVDLKNLPQDFKEFVRLPVPDHLVKGPLRKYVSEYVVKDDHVEDSWTVVDMTDDEKQNTISNQLTAVVETLRLRKADAIVELEKASNDLKEWWSDYISKLDAIDTSDPFGVVFPIPPRQDKDGKWIYTTLPGSAPNVIV